MANPQAGPAPLKPDAAPPQVRPEAGPAQGLSAAGPLQARPQPAPSPARVPDTLGQRLMACTACHGAEGRATNQGYFPRIAGKPADYLYRQLTHFKDGRRQHATMAALLQNLSDAYLRDMANHFAALDLPYPPAQPAQAPAAVLARGQALALQGDAARGLPACSACHGEALTGVLPAVPGLLGLPQDYLVVQFGAWRHGLRRADAPDCMARIAQRLDGADVAAVAAWLAAQPVPAPAHPAPPRTTAAPMACGGIATGVAPSQASTSGPRRLP